MVLSKRRLTNVVVGLGSRFVNRIISRSNTLHGRLRQDPIPLLDGERRTIISWSAKSACTHVLIWYLQRVGLLTDSRAYHRWVHRYRREVLYRSSSYKKVRRLLAGEGPSVWTYVKVVRDPVKRCISSYRHAVRYGYEDKKISRVLGRRIDHIQGFSFEEFLEYLGHCDLRTVNLHHRLQTHPLDSEIFARTWLINADEKDLEGALAEIDRKQGVGSIVERPDRIEAIASAARRHAANVPDRGSVKDLWRIPLRKTDVNNWPSEALRKSEEASALVRAIYAKDYEMLAWMGKKAEPCE